MKIYSGHHPVHLWPQDLKALHQARNLIEKSYPHWPLSKHLTRRTGLNLLKLKVGFPHLFHQTPYEYHLDLKMTQIKHLLLQNTPLPIIAHQTGYKHPSTLSRQFKKATGLTPTAFKKKN